MKRWFLTARDGLRNAVRLICSGVKRMWCTRPRLDQAGVNGIMRQFCLQSLAQSPFQVVEVYAREDALMQADEMVICNALMPVIPVRACGDKLMFARSLFDFLAPLCEHPN